MLSTRMVAGGGMSRARLCGSSKKAKTSSMGAATHERQRSTAIARRLSAQMLSSGPWRGMASAVATMWRQASGTSVHEQV